jgi:hypothetical protein
MKRFTGLLILGLLMVATSSFGAACTQTLTSYGPNMKELVFVCTAASGTFTATATSTANTNAIKGFYVTDVYTFPGGTAPTEASAVTLSTGDSPAWDILGGIGVVSATLAKRFLPPATLPSSSLAGNTVRNALTVGITGNAVSAAIVTVKVILWNN